MFRIPCVTNYDAFATKRVKATHVVEVWVRLDISKNLAARKMLLEVLDRIGQLYVVTRSFEGTLNEAT